MSGELSAERASMVYTAGCEPRTADSFPEDVVRVLAELGYWLGEAHWGKWCHDGSCRRGHALIPSRLMSRA